MQDTFTAEATRGDEKLTNGMSDNSHSNPMSATMAGPGASENSMDKQISAPSPTHQPTNGKHHNSAKEVATDRLEDITNLEDHDFGDSPDVDISEFVEGAQHSDKPPSRPDRSMDAAIPHHDSESTRHDSNDSNAIRSTFSGETLSARGGKDRKGSGGSNDSSGPREHSPHLHARSTPANGKDNNTIAGKARSTMQSFIQSFSPQQQQQRDQTHHNDDTNLDYTSHHPTSNTAPEYTDAHSRRQRRQQQMGGHEAEENATRRRQQQQRQGDRSGSASHGTKDHPIKATLRKHKPYSKRRTGEEDEEEEEEIGVHMWEKGSGEVVLDVPWFKSKLDGGV